MADDDLAIEVRDLVMRYDQVTALDGLNLQVRKGGLFGLLGPNGAGKTTLISILCGLQRATSGECQVARLDAWAQGYQVRARIGVCPQSGAVFPHLTARENVELFGGLQGLSKKDARVRADRLLERMGLESDADRKAGEFSEGMKRRLSVAMALVHDPEIAFLDEPTVGMDPQSRRAVWDFITQLKEQGKTVILTTHYMEEAQQLCDQIGIIDRGRLIALGTPGQLIQKQGKKDLEEVFIELTGRKIREEL